MLSQNIQSQLSHAREEAEENDAQRRAKKSHLPYLNLISTKVPTELEAMRVIKEVDARAAELVPIRLLKKKLSIALFDPEKPEAKQVIEKLGQKYSIDLYISSKRSLNHAFSYYAYITETKEITGRLEMDEKKLSELKKSIKTLQDFKLEIETFDKPYISEILEIIIGGSLALRSSDIHLEPGKKNNLLRIRVDGLLHQVSDTLSEIMFNSIGTRIKLLSELKLNVKDTPQDGRFTIVLNDRDIEIRTSVIPSEYGETIVMRILDPVALKTNLEELGFRPDDLSIINTELVKPHGLILNTGPTGSGKTTSLYAFLRIITKPEIKIITIEDPIEYHIPGISQTQTNQDAGYDFGSGLRSIMRQDPDVILVGEIRDEETASIALNASLTGHLVLSTLHTNDSIGAIPRLMELGVKAETIGPALSLVIAQRLVRRLCNHCKKAVQADDIAKQNIEKLLASLPAKIDQKPYKNWQLYEPVGCDACGGIGYFDRISIFELFLVTRELENIIYKKPTHRDIRQATEKDLVTLQKDGILKALQGITSLDEVSLVTGPLEW